MAIRSLGCFLLLFISVFTGWSDNGRRKNLFNFKAWQASYGQPIDLAQWLESHPLPWNDYWQKDEPECAQKWYIQLGPLGLRTLMHDEAYAQFKGHKAIFPKCLIQNGELKINAFEILAVDPAGPLGGKLQPGDYLIAINGQKFISGAKLPEAKEIAINDTRSLELHAGLLIDRAEGDGQIALTILRVPKARQNGGFLTAEEMGKYQQVVRAKIPRLGTFGEQVTPDNPKLFNLSMIMAERLVTQQNQDGSWSGAPSWASQSFYTSMCALGLMAFDGKRYQEQVRRAAHYVAYQGTFSEWTYDQGTIIIFLSEYFLRYRDKSILKGLEWIMDEATKGIQEDFTAGHKAGPGYGGGGWLGGGGVIACGYAVASHTPITKYNELVDNMLVTVQNLSPRGLVPYGRGVHPQSFDSNPVTGQWGGAATGPYLTASLIRGGATYFTKVAGARYTDGPWGNADGGHATHTLPFIWSGIATACLSTKAHFQNMSSFIWRLTTHREFTGLGLTNASRLEYMKCEHLLGLPYWHTGGMLILINAHKRNLAITGHPRYRAKKFRPVPKVNQLALAFRSTVEQTLRVVRTQLGKRSPKSLHVAIAKVNAIPLTEELADHVFSVMKSDMPQVARDISQIGGIDPLIKAYLMEMVLGVEHKIEQVAPDEKASASSSPTQDGLQVSSISVYDKWTGVVSAKVKAAGLAQELRFVGQVSIADPQSSALSSPQMVTLKPGEKTVVGVKVGTTDYPLVATFDYSVGDIRIKYKRPLVLNSSNQRKLSINNRRLWVDGFLERHLAWWTLPFRLPDGALVTGTDHVDWTTNRAAVIVKERGEVVNLEQSAKAVVQGTPCRFLIETGNLWDFFVHEVDIMKPDYLLTQPEATELSAGWSGSSADLFDQNRDTGITSTGETAEMVLDLKSPGYVKHVVWHTMKRNGNTGGFRLDIMQRGRWRMAARGQSRQGSQQMVDLPRNRAEKVRIVFNLKAGEKLSLGEVQLAVQN